MRCEAVTVQVRYGMLPAVHDGAIRLVCVSMAERSYLYKVSRGDCGGLEICSRFCYVE